ncbi:MAG TPA: hypothetical protein RMG45_27880, partial [Polyangiaceae bacterium LLY-WYZ-15_(1-7)]|nr:hypothetical protein [Polyangiaceae bacterium LLY-WYZ-15_(1-7)]
MSAEGAPRRGRLWGALALLVLLGAGLAWWLLGRGPRLRPEPLENVPDGAVAVARVELGAVMRSSLWRHFVSARGGDAGLERLRERCGFDPADQVEELVVFVSGEEPDSLDHVTVLARGPFDHEALGGCMRTVLEEEGRGMRQVEIDGVPAVAGERGDSRVAFLGRDGAVFGHEDAVREVIATLQGEGETAASDATLSDLWARVAHDRDVGVAARVPAHWRETATRRLEASPARGILAELASLEALGLGARVSRGLALGL